ncbi:gas vesicle protein GvpO [Halorubellus salinus]|uniref:gas vesicle protein GvpO n=1 Tax=Halorubellus salinus TaxID=755309 RepID=UPI001D08DEAB|nr:gas vesicle protein GvpO [Halorubellus salinus]
MSPDTNNPGDGSDDSPPAETDATADGDTEPIGLAAAKDEALAAAEELIDHPIDSVIRIERSGDAWRTLVEVVERSAIPDTQDILGRYEIVVDDSGQLTEYGLEERYRRGESREEL